MEEEIILRSTCGFDVAHPAAHGPSLEKTAKGTPRSECQLLAFPPMGSALCYSSSLRLKKGLMLSNGFLLLSGS